MKRYNLSLDETGLFHKNTNRGRWVEDILWKILVFYFTPGNSSQTASLPRNSTKFVRSEVRDNKALIKP